jgi:hypothetical protein
MFVATGSAGGFSCSMLFSSISEYVNYRPG